MRAVFGEARNAAHIDAAGELPDLLGRCLRERLVRSPADALSRPRANRVLGFGSSTGSQKHGNTPMAGRSARAATPPAVLANRSSSRSGDHYPLAAAWHSCLASRNCSADHPVTGVRRQACATISARPATRPTVCGNLGPASCRSAMVRVHRGLEVADGLFDSRVSAVAFQRRRRLPRRQQLRSEPALVGCRSLVGSPDPASPAAITHAAFTMELRVEHRLLDWLTGPLKIGRAVLGSELDRVMRGSILGPRIDGDPTVYPASPILPCG